MASNSTMERISVERESSWDSAGVISIFSNKNKIGEIKQGERITLKNIERGEHLFMFTYPNSKNSVGIRMKVLEEDKIKFYLKLHPNYGPIVEVKQSKHLQEVKTANPKKFIWPIYTSYRKCTIYDLEGKFSKEEEEKEKKQAEEACCTIM